MQLNRTSMPWFRIFIILEHFTGEDTMMFTEPDSFRTRFDLIVWFGSYNPDPRQLTTPAQGVMVTANTISLASFVEPYLSPQRMKNNMGISTRADLRG